MKPFEINPKKTTNEIIKFIRKKVKELNRDGIIFGLSGGLDSSVIAALCAKAIAPEKITAMLMFEKDSDKQHMEDAIKLAKQLKIKIKKHDLTKELENYPVYKYAPRLLINKLLIRKGLKYLTEKKGKGFLYFDLEKADNPIIKRANAFFRIKHRLRMLHLYYEAELKNLLVVGAANKTEEDIGFFVKFGIDHCADIMPMIHLYKTQVRQLANYLKIPTEIIEKSPAPDFLPGITDEDAIGLGYNKLDLILYTLEKGKLNKINKIIKKLNVTQKEIKYVKDLIKGSKHMRESPYFLNQ